MGRSEFYRENKELAKRLADASAVVGIRLASPDDGEGLSLSDLEFELSELRGVIWEIEQIIES